MQKSQDDPVWDLVIVSREARERLSGYFGPRSPSLATRRSLWIGDWPR